MTATKAARTLAWVGIGLGIAEVLAPRRLAHATGLAGQARLVRTFGVREIASGLLILAARDPAAWLWTRVVGDALDGALLSSRLRPSNPGRGRALAATVAVAPVVVLDAYYAFRRR